MNLITIAFSKYKRFYTTDRSLCILTSLFILLFIAKGLGLALGENWLLLSVYEQGAGQNFFLPGFSESAQNLFLPQSHPNIAYGGVAVAMVAAAAISAGGAMYGADQNKKASDANTRNQQAYNKAIQASEKEARKLYDGYVKEWKKAQKEQGEDLSLQQFISDQIAVLDDPQLQDLYYSVKQEDWDLAQQMADEATEQNMSSFNRLVDNVSGGDYDALVQARNQSVLGADAQSIYNRARELQAPSIMAGSARQGGDSTFQRADRQEYNVAQESIQQADEIRFTRARAAIEDDRVAAQRQQERALSFLPAIDYTGYANSAVVSPSQSARLQLGMSELNFYANMAAQSMNAAFRPPTAPPAIATNPGDALIKAGMEGTTSALAGYYNQQGGQSSQGSGSQVPANNVSTAPASTNQSTYSVAGNQGTYGGSGK